MKCPYDQRAIKAASLSTLVSSFTSIFIFLIQNQTSILKSCLFVLACLLPFRRIMDGCMNNYYLPIYEQLLIIFEHGMQVRQDNQQLDRTQMKSIFSLVQGICQKPHYGLHFSKITQLDLNIPTSNKFTTDSCHSLVRALITSRLDYCNGLLGGAPTFLLARLSGVLRAAARLVLQLPRMGHISVAMKE